MKREDKEKEKKTHTHPHLVNGKSNLETFGFCASGRLSNILHKGDDDVALAFRLGIIRVNVELICSNTGPIKSRGKLSRTDHSPLHDTESGCADAAKVEPCRKQHLFALKEILHNEYFTT